MPILPISRGQHIAPSPALVAGPPSPATGSLCPLQFPAPTFWALSLTPTGTLVLCFPEQLGAVTPVPLPWQLLQLEQGVRVWSVRGEGLWGLGSHRGLTRWCRLCCSRSSSRNRLLHRSFSAPSSVQRKRTSASSASSLRSMASLALPCCCSPTTALAPQLSSCQSPMTPASPRDTPGPGTHLSVQAPVQNLSPHPPPPHSPLVSAAGLCRAGSQHGQ